MRTKWAVIEQIRVRREVDSMLEVMFCSSVTLAFNVKGEPKGFSAEMNVSRN